MWSKVAKEMGIPWRAVEAMHWHLGSKRWPVAPVWHRFHGPKILFEPPPPRTMSGHLCDGNGKVSRVHHGNFHHAKNYLPVSQYTNTEDGESEWKVVFLFLVQIAIPLWAEIFQNVARKQLQGIQEYHCFSKVSSAYLRRAFGWSSSQGIPPALR